MKTIEANCKKSIECNERQNIVLDAVEKGLWKVFIYNIQTASSIERLRVLTGKASIVIVMLMVSVSLFAQPSKTNYIGKNTSEVKAAMNSFSMRLYTTGTDTKTGNLFVIYVDQYFGTIIYTFNQKNVCESYIIKSAIYHKNKVIDLIRKEFNKKTDDEYFDGKYTATVDITQNIVTICVK